AFVSETLVFSADIKTYTDYYAFGMEMVGRNWSESEAYRFGHNGQEKSKEVGEDNYTAEFWEYDSQTIRRFNVDPVVKEYESPYLAFGGNPILNTDVKGDDASSTACDGCPDNAKVGAVRAWGGTFFVYDETNKWVHYKVIQHQEVTITTYLTRFERVDIINQKIMERMHAPNLFKSIYFASYTSLIGGVGTSFAIKLGLHTTVARFIVKAKKFITKPENASNLIGESIAQFAANRFELQKMDLFDVATNVIVPKKSFLGVVADATVKGFGDFNFDGNEGGLKTIVGGHQTKDFGHFVIDAGIGTAFGKGGDVLGDMMKNKINKFIDLGTPFIRDNGKFMTTWKGVSGTAGNMTQDASKGFYDYINNKQ
ncbi:MAG: hypothetical protein EAY69_01415, partial [Cytophagales bacterium]